MTFKFQEGDAVVLKNGEGHAWFLPAGSRGTIFCQYASVPPAYEVNFMDVRGKVFGSVVYEAEIELAPDDEVIAAVREAVSAA